MHVPKLSESKFIHLSVMIIFIPEKPLAMTASNCGTNKYSNSFLIFRKAASITESPHKLLLFLDYLQFSFYFFHCFLVICIFWLLLMQDKS